MKPTNLGPRARGSYPPAGGAEGGLPTRCGGESRRASSKHLLVGVCSTTRLGGLLVRDIENMPNEYEYSKLFFERWYRPQFTTIIVAGDVTADQVLPLVDKYWAGWKAG